MPVHKGVATLSTLCVQRIGQLFIEITKFLNQCSASKKNGILAKQKIVNKKDADHKSEENRDEKDVQSQSKTQEMEEKNSPKPELLESNGDTTAAAEQLAEMSMTPPLSKENERRKKQEGELQMSMKLSFHCLFKLSLILYYNEGFYSID